MAADPEGVMMPVVRDRVRPARVDRCPPRVVALQVLEVGVEEPEGLRAGGRRLRGNELPAAEGLVPSGMVIENF
jgi:hypothetical protein